MKFAKEAKIGFIVLLVLAMFFWGLNFLKGKNLFSVNNHYYALFTDVAGLQNSTAVTTNGLVVGHVSAIGFYQNDLNQIMVEVSLNQNFSFPKNSVLQIYNTDFLGGKGIRLITGNALVPAQNGDTLQAVLESDILTALKESLMPIADEATSVLNGLDSLLSDVRQTLNPQMRKDIQEMVSETRMLIAGERERLGLIMEHLESFTGNLEQNNDHLNTIASNMAAFSDSLASSDFKPAIASLNRTLGEIETMMNQVNSGEGSLGRLAYDETLYSNLAKTLAQLDSLLADLQNNPVDYVHFSLFGRKRKGN